MTDDRLIEAAGKEWIVTAHPGAGDRPSDRADAREAETMIARAVDGSEERSLHIGRNASKGQIAAAIAAGRPDNPA